jgi:hypothetical protein
LLAFYLASTHQLNYLLESWLHNVSDTLKKLGIRIVDPTDDLSTSEVWLPQRRALRVLRVNASLPGLNLASLLHSLVDLELTCMSVQTEQLVSALHANPKLQWLKLSDFVVQPTVQSAISPVALDHLEHVVLFNLGFGSLRVLLLLISAKSTPLSLYIVKVWNPQSPDTGRGAFVPRRQIGVRS